jgi:thiol-disulfide isomerase/thioredoxin
MRTLLALAALAGLAAPAMADDPKKDQPAPSLKVGDPAPPLTATRWLQGPAVREFSPGKVCVVEFWATWCGPCIVMMPHLGEVQAQYRDQGLTVIGFTARDPNNTAEKVAAFVKKRGPKLGYTFAFADDNQTHDAYMKAAGRTGIPCSFVVGKDGKVAYIGHPMYLDEVLPKVVAGAWTPEDAAGLKEVEKEVMDVFKALSGSDAAAGLKALSAFEAKRPKLAHIPYFVGPKLSLLLKAGKTDEARQTAEGVLARAVRREDPTALRTVSAALRAPEASGDKALLGLSLKAAEAYLKAAGDDDPMALLNLAETHFAAGDKAKAKECGAKALAAAEKDAPGVKRYVETQVKKFGDKE